MSFLLNEAVDVFSFPPRVGAHIDRIHVLPVQYSADDAELFCHRRNHFIFKIIRDKRKRLETPFLERRIIGFRVAHRYKMTDTPRNNRLIRFQISVSPFCLQF